MSEIITATPIMDHGGLACFKETLKHSRCYLEYGCGGSTVYACHEAKVAVIISVDSDRAWVENVASSLMNATSTLLIQHCDIGEVGDWGTPTSENNIHGFWKYMVAPWKIAKSGNHVPDTILVDGRFRVACFLYSLLSARVGTTILFDDYLNRPHYFVVENFCKLKELHGRMGVFTVDHHFSMTEICEKIAEYSIISK